ncbi:phospho-N-acetylmuramoyl-pentapeptide-transferase [Allobaculum stercoricanis]|uniref:phospho-N-acetylmuramoyl-pentapeptide- transferase n=1 Tax=Allobaculum stercoricanis TaxID=174709 RepID=UPI0023F459AD|nr:phospho-N-acetylmuramoyl-pentapeptide-transferase [Allobaculum stercoricanis]
MNHIVPIDWSMIGLAIVLGIVVLIGMLAFMPALIRYLHKLKFGQTEREEGLASHKAKTGTPTMGGLAFLIVPFIVYFIASFFTPLNWDNSTVIMWIAYLGFGLIGFVDDYIIVVQKSNEGLKPALKFGLQAVLAVLLTVYYMMHNPTLIHLPGHIQWLAPTWFFVILIFFLFTGSSNAVNLSDGVDGLCAGLSIISFVPFALVFAWQGQYSACAILIMVIFALFGYLRFNIHPAKVFMGDTGSLALGGILAAAAMTTKMELLLLIAGGVFIVETLSDIIQVLYYKNTHRRVFLMAPLHHHFEKKGWSEMKVCTVFWSWGAILAAISIFLAFLAL